MTEIEKVEKLREKASVSYADAKRALVACDWDILDAMILLEEEGRTSSSQRISAPAYSTWDGQGNAPPRGERESAGNSFLDLMASFFNWLGKILGLGNSNEFVASKNGEQALAIPVTIFVIFLVFCFWIVIPLLIIGLFFGFKYSFRGPELGRDSINNAMHKASDIVSEIKKEIIIEFEAEFKNKPDQRD